MIRSKNETEDLVLSIIKNCETLIQHSHTQPQETLELKTTKPRKTFHFSLPISIEGSWMIGLTDLEVYIDFFIITEPNFKFELYKFPDEKDGGISYTKVRDEIEKVLDIPDFTATDLQDDIICPISIGGYREQVTKRMEDVGYMNIFLGYPNSVFQDLKVISEQKLIWLKMMLDWY